MPDSKITALTALTAADPANDMIPIVDVSDTPPASGNTKRISINNILACSPTATLASATITGDLTVDTSTLKVDSANNRVGIGTASPGVTFDVAGPIRSIVSGGTPFLYLNNGTSQHSLSNDSNALSISVFAAEQMRIAASGVFTFYDGAGGTRMTLNSTGLGVGVSPSYKLDVQGADNSIIAQFGGTSRKVNFTTSANGGFANGFFNFVSTSSVGAFSFQNASGTLLTIDSGGNVGIGVTPSAWPAASKAIDVDSYGANYAIATATQVGISRNCYYNGTNWIYKLTTSAQRFEADNGGGFKWFTAAAGTAGTAVTFTQSMTLDASGNLILQSSATPATLTTNGQLTVNATSNTNLRFSYRGSDGVTRVANITLA